MGEEKRRGHTKPLTPRDAVAITMRVLREKKCTLAEITDAIAHGVVAEAMLRAESKGATWDDADGFRLAGEEFSELLDEIRRLGLAKLDLPTAGN